MGRHQTLLATIQWSYDHLAPDHQQLLRRLSVFVGGWTLEGAIRVADERADEYEVLDLLARLIDQSLVSTHRAGATTRYSMLETVRQYASDRLNEAGEGEATRDRHLEFYVALAEEAEPGLVGPEQSAWLSRLDCELENFLAAHARSAHAAGGAELGLRLVFSLKLYLRQRGLTLLAHRITVEALARAGAQKSDLLRCQALWAAGEHSFSMGRYGEASDYGDASLAIAKAMGDEGRLAEALRLKGHTALALGDRAAARDHFKASLTKSRQLKDQVQICRALNGLGELHRAEGELEDAKSLYEEALALSTARGDRGSRSTHLVNLAWTLIGLGEEKRVRTMLLEALAVAEDLGSKRISVTQLDCTTGLAAAAGDWERAAQFHGATEALSEQLGYRREPPDGISLAPLLARTREALGAAAFADAEAAGRALSYEEVIASARACLEQRESSLEAVAVR